MVWSISTIWLDCSNFVDWNCTNALSKAPTPQHFAFLTFDTWRCVRLISEPKNQRRTSSRRHASHNFAISFAKRSQLKVFDRSFRSYTPSNWIQAITPYSLPPNHYDYFAFRCAESGDSRCSRNSRPSLLFLHRLRPVLLQRRCTSTENPLHARGSSRDSEDRFASRTST